MAEKVSAAESDTYFAMLRRGSQIGAAASDQSQPIANADVLRQLRFAELERLYGDDQPIPRPQNWGGYRIRPTRIEFWQGRENRLHDRILYTRDAQGEWTITRLAP